MQASRPRVVGEVRAPRYPGEKERAQGWVRWVSWKVRARPWGRRFLSVRERERV